MIKVIYTDKRGASCMRAFGTSDEAAKFMAHLYCEATVIDEAGSEIGRVWRLDPSERQDQRRKWGWLIEA